MAYIPHYLSNTAFLYDAICNIDIHMRNRNDYLALSVGPDLMISFCSDILKTGIHQAPPHFSGGILFHISNLLFIKNHLCMSFLEKRAKKISPLSWVLTAFGYSCSVANM